VTLYFVSIIFILAVVALNVWAFPVNGLLPITIALAGVFVLIYLLIKMPSGFNKALLFVLMVVGFSNLIFNVNFYPKLLTYQGAIPLSRFVKDNKIKADSIYTFLPQRAFAFDYYIQNDLREIGLKDLQRPENAYNYLLTDNNKIKEIPAVNDRYNILTTVHDFHVTELTLPFLNPKRRSNELDSLILLVRK
jgi:hypothetical protein